MNQLFEANVSDSLVNDVFCEHLFRLSEDPVPNIRFNVSKTIDTMHSKLSAANKERAVTHL